MVVNDPATSLPMEVDAGLTATCDRCGALSLRSPFSWRWRDALFEGRSNEVQYGQVAEPSSDSAPRFLPCRLSRRPTATCYLQLSVVEPKLGAERLRPAIRAFPFSVSFDPAPTPLQFEALSRRLAYARSARRVYKMRGPY